MPRQVAFKTKWTESGDGQTCKVIAIDSRTRRIIAVVNISVPVYTAADFAAIYGNTLKKQIEASAKDSAGIIAQRTP